MKFLKKYFWSILKIEIKKKKKIDYSTITSGFIFINVLNMIDRNAIKIQYIASWLLHNDIGLKKLLKELIKINNQMPNGSQKWKLLTI